MINHGNAKQDYPKFSLPLMNHQKFLAKRHLDKIMGLMYNCKISQSFNDYDYKNKFQSRKQERENKILTIFQDIKESFFRKLPLFKIDPYCLKRSKLGKCLECIDKYQQNHKTGLCQIRYMTNISIQDQIIKSGCLIFSQYANMCIKCQNRYLNQRDYPCHNDKYNSLDELFGVENQLQPIMVFEQIQIKSGHFKADKIQLKQKQPNLKNQTKTKLITRRTSLPQLFLIDQKFLNSSVSHKKNTQRKQNTERNNCKTRQNNKSACLLCNDGYILNPLSRTSQCTKINQPYYLFRQPINDDKKPSDKMQQQQQIQVQVIKPQYLSKVVVIDSNCALYNPNIRNSNPCLSCIEGFYLSVNKQKCVQIDHNCSISRKSTGQCIECKYGYIPNYRSCILINANNYQQIMIVQQNFQM